MIYLLPLLTSILYRLRGSDGKELIGKVGLCLTVAVFLATRYYRFYIWDINCDDMFEKCFGTHIVQSIITIILLTGVYRSNLI